MPVVADCEIMCWPFLEHALLIWVCLMVYKKPTVPPPPPPHYHLPIPHLPKACTAPSKASSAGEGSAGARKGRFAGFGSMQGGVTAWELTDDPEGEGSQCTKSTFWNLSHSSTCPRMLRCTCKDIPGNRICDSEHRLTNPRTI